MIGPHRSSYCPAAARVDAIITRADRAVICAVCSSRKRSSLAVCSWRKRSSLPPAAAAALLAQDANIVDARGLVDGFDHVVERQRGDADRGQSFHLHAGAV